MWRRIRAVAFWLVFAPAVPLTAAARPTLTPLSPYTSFDPAAAGVVGSPALSPDGRHLAFLHAWNPVGRNARGTVQLFVHHFDDDSITQITTGDSLVALRHPTWSPDGLHLYVSAESGDPPRRELYRSMPYGSNFQRLTHQDGTTGLDPIERCAPTAGGGVFLATAADLLREGHELRRGARNIYYRRGNGMLERVSDPGSDLFPEAEVHAADAAGTHVIFAPEDPDLPRARPLRPFRLDRSGAVTALTPLEGSTLLDLHLTPRGHRLYLASTADYLGGGSSGRPQIFLRDMESGALTQLTFASFGGARRPAADSAATRLVFESSASLVPGDVSGSSRVYLSDGQAGNIRRISTGQEPTISADGQWLAFRDTADSLGGNADLSPEIFAVRTDGLERRQISRFVRGSSQQPDVSTDGAWVVFASTGDLDGGNSDGSREIYRVRPDGSELKRLTSTPRGKSCEQPSVNATGTHVAFVSNGNLFPGDNDDGNFELFLVRLDGDSLIQVTETGSGNSGSPRLSDDAGVIAFVTTSPVIPTSPMGSGRVAVWTRTTDRFRFVTPPADRTLDALYMDDGGKRLAVLSTADLEGLNSSNTRSVYTVSTSGLSLVRRGLSAAPRTGGLGLSAAGNWLAVTDVNNSLVLHHYEGGDSLPVPTPTGLSPVYPVPSNDGSLVACAVPVPAAGYQAGDYLLLNQATSQVTALIEASQPRPPEPPAMSGTGGVIAFTLSSVDTLNPDGSVEVMAAAFNGVPVRGVTMILEWQAATGSVLLRWRLGPGAAPVVFVVERGPTPSGPWQELGRAGNPTPEGEFTFRDATAPGDASWYRLTAILRNGSLDRFGPWPVAPPESPRPRIAATPNPFASETRLTLQQEAGRAVVELFDLRGRRVRLLMDAVLPAGTTSLTWDGRDERGDMVAAGVYYCSLNRSSTVTIVRSR